ncbi:hypothetical protein LLH06_05430 [Mucilaginibacter daejeonensis]|uniref:hypothetical protein n=1 Tax=Mucilaginibacter daejeonensis TaxID=398049 RepID=UPI001D179160|nr:hypothetical protein [Mucilaginibacter daejeonensis]UEG54406.1 hypothetical protein LLH06_05430 [Mucilaginibacter daejeonensis]
MAIQLMGGISQQHLRTSYLYLSIITCLIIGACHNDKVEPFTKRAAYRHLGS